MAVPIFLIVMTIGLPLLSGLPNALGIVLGLIR